MLFEEVEKSGENVIPSIDKNIFSTEPDQIADRDIRASIKQRIITGWGKNRIWGNRIVLNLYQIIRLYRSPYKVYKILKTVQKIRGQISGKKGVIKIAEVGGTYYWRLNVPGWGTPIFPHFLSSELNRIEKHGRPTYRLVLAYVAITKKCPLKCEHCFEWDNLNKPERLSSTDIQNIVDHLQEIGTASIALTGGEPMLRIKDMIPVIQNSHDKSAFWILTSGFNFTHNNANDLKIAGLTGVVISLDHHIPEMHNRFRGRKESFQEVLNAVKRSIENDLVTAISVCVTRETATEEFLTKYMELARYLGVSFVQFLEPKAVGHYSGKDVLLKNEHFELLEKFYLKMNYERSFRDFPIVIYHGYYQRRVGCMASGNRSVYVDTDGEILGCPFCHEKGGSAMEKGYAQAIDQLALKGCGPYESIDY